MTPPTFDFELPEELTIDTDAARRIIGEFIRAQLAQAGFGKVLLGLSGGIDSALVAYLAAEAIGPENVFAILMPYKTSSPESRGDAETITAERVLIATGAAPRELPFAPADGKRIISSYDAMILPKRPKKLLVVGSGAIGMEFAYFYNAFGTEVTVVEMLDRILPVEDREISKLAQRVFKRQGITFHTSAALKSLEAQKKGVVATIADVNDDSKTQTLEADVALVAIGVQGRTDALCSDTLGLAMDRGYISTDFQTAEEPTYATSVPGIYAIGDIIGPPWLAHVASEEAVTCVERLAGHHTLGVDYDAIPGCTYTNPQVASVGMTEDAAKEKGLDYQVSTFQLKAHGKAIAVGATDGVVRLITSKPYGEILGAHIFGEDASELIHEICLAIRLEATAEDLISTMHAHPTMAESIHEAALGVEGRMIHN